MITHAWSVHGSTWHDTEIIERIEVRDLSIAWERPDGTPVYDWENERWTRAYEETDFMASMGDAVYFILCQGPGLFIKIGHTASFKVRMSGMQGGCPYPLIPLEAIPTGGKDLEKYLHWKFEHLQVRNEWFMPGTDLLSFIAGVSEIINEITDESYDFWGAWRALTDDFVT
jgi:hypothetical protein